MKIEIGRDKFEMAKAAAAFAADRIKAAIAARGEARVIFASAASQLEFVDEMLKRTDIEWNKVCGFHLDEYVGIPATHKASFRGYMRERFVAKTPQPLKVFNEVNGEAADPDAEIARLKAELADAQGELSLAYRQFDQALDPELVESCIYQISAVKARCNYLIRAIKERSPETAAAVQQEGGPAWT